MRKEKQTPQTSFTDGVPDLQGDLHWSGHSLLCSHDDTLEHWLPRFSPTHLTVPIYLWVSPLQAEQGHCHSLVQFLHITLDFLTCGCPGKEVHLFLCLARGPSFYQAKFPKGTAGQRWPSLATPSPASASHCPTQRSECQMLTLPRIGFALPCHSPQEVQNADAVGISK